MNKLKNINQIGKLSKELGDQGKKIGLITGCFDIVHIGHVRFIAEAKRYVDVLIVGLDNDENVKLSKGSDRPFFKLNDRLEMISKIEDIDYVFPIEGVFSFNSSEANEELLKITRLINPDFLIANIKSDKYWKEKALRAKKLGIKLVKLKQQPESTTKIARLIGTEH